MKLFVPMQPHTLLQRVKSCISDEEEEKLMQITSLHSLNAFLLPIKTVGVQVSPRPTLQSDPGKRYRLSDVVIAMRIVIVITMVLLPLRNPNEDITTATRRTNGYDTSTNNIINLDFTAFTRKYCEK